MLTVFKSDGVVKCIEAGEDAIHGGPTEGPVYYCITEFLAGGTLFDFVQNGVYTESLACYLFEELAKIVNEINLQGYAHLDLKLENIMFDKNGKMKVIDFGFMKELSGFQGKGKIKCYAGTIPYKAPEIVSCVPFKGHAADTFALGVILFALLGKTFPFDEATKTDGFYSLLQQQKYEEYWKAVSESSQAFNPSVQNLLGGLFAFSPLTRVTIPEVLSHDWIKNTEKPSDEEARKIIKKICHLP